MSDTITILRSRGRRLAKLVAFDGTIASYDSAKTFTATQHDIAGLDELYLALTWLSGRPDRCIVRGGLVDPSRTSSIRRLLYDDPATGESATLRENPHKWLATDWDGLERPTDTDTTDIEACGRIAISRLPPTFRKARCIAQLTGSHGIKPGVRVRLWHWLDRPLHGGELTRWLGHVEGMDASVFRCAQVIYTAAPIFETRLDHLPRRLAMLTGKSAVATPSPAALAPPPAKPAAPLPKPGDTRADRYAFAALRNALTRVNMATEGQRHPALKREALNLARFVQAGLLPAASIRSALADAARMIGKPEGESDRLFDWAMAHPAAVHLPEGL